MKSVLIILIGALAISLSFLACDPKAEKIKAYNDIISTTTFRDTALTYSLFSDSLVLTFAKKPEITHWYGEIFLLKLKPYEEIHIPFPHKTADEMGHLTIRNKKLTFSGFHIPTDSLRRYFIHFRAAPYFPGFYSWGDIYSPAYLFSSELDGSNDLRINDVIRNFKITSFDLVKLKKMSPELSDFCRDSIEKAFHVTFTDVEIEESSYNY